MQLDDLLATIGRTDHSLKVEEQGHYQTPKRVTADQLGFIPSTETGLGENEVVTLRPRLFNEAFQIPLVDCEMAGMKVPRMSTYFYHFEPYLKNNEEELHRRDRTPSA